MLRKCALPLVTRFSKTPRVSLRFGFSDKMTLSKFFSETTRQHICHETTTEKKKKKNDGEKLSKQKQRQGTDTDDFIFPTKNLPSAFLSCV